MRLNGASTPHHGAPPAIGGSIGVIKYRDKQWESYCSYNILNQYYQSNNNSNYIEKIINNSIEVNWKNSSDKNAQNNASDNNQQARQESLNNSFPTKHTDDSDKCENVDCKRNVKVDVLTDARRVGCSNDNSNMADNIRCRLSSNMNNAQSIVMACNRTFTNDDSGKKESISDIKSVTCNDAATSSPNQVALMDNQNPKVHMSISTVIITLATTTLLIVLDCVVWNALRIVRAQQSLHAAASSSDIVVQKLLRRLRQLLSPPSLDTVDGATSSNGGKSCFSPTRLLMGFLCSLLLMPVGHVRCDDSDNFFAVNTFSLKPGPETTTAAFDYASRGKKMFGDKCENTLECGFPGSICDPKLKSCQCTEDLPVTNHIDKCGKEAAVNESCFFNEQCEVKYFQTECRDGRCVCRFEMTPIWGKDGSVECSGRQEKRGPETYIDPAMIGVLVGMALMFIIICVVLRLFSQARWRENRTIFNTPNPRLMNVSLLRDSKLLHGQERRGSRMSVRAPSRQPSMASLRPHSPNPSLGKTGSRSGSHGSGSNVSAASVRSTRSNSVAPGHVGNGHNHGHGHGHHERKGSSNHHHQHHHQSHHQQQQEPLITNITANPVAENVTVEIVEPQK